MPPFVGLTYQQASLIRQLVSAKGVRVRWLGIDAKGLPVIQFRDQRRTTEPFAIPRIPNPSASVKPKQPIRQFTDEDLDVIDETDHELICRMQRSPLADSAAPSAAKDDDRAGLPRLVFEEPSDRK